MSVEQELAQIVIQTQAGLIQRPWDRISAIIHSFFFPQFPSSARGQFVFLSVVYAIFIILAFACLWLRRKSLPLFRRVDGFVVVNTPLLFVGPIFIYLILSEVTIQKTIRILDGKRTFSYEGIYILRGGSWTFLYLAGWYKGLGTLIESAFTSKAVQKSTFAPTTEKKTRRRSILAAYALPLLHFIWLWPLQGAVTAVCDGFYHKWEVVEDRALDMASKNNLTNFLTDVQAFITPLKDLSDAGEQCILVNRIAYGTVIAWIVLTLMTVGGTAFYNMRKRLRSQVELYEKLAQDWKELSARQNLQLSYTGADPKVRLMKLAASDLTLSGLAYFGCCVSYCADLSLVLASGSDAQFDGAIFVTIQLWAFYTFALLGVPVLYSSLRSAWVERGAPPLYLQNEILSSVKDGSLGGSNTPKFVSPPFSSNNSLSPPSYSGHSRKSSTHSYINSNPPLPPSFPTQTHVEPPSVYFPGLQPPHSYQSQSIPSADGQWLRPNSAKTVDSDSPYPSYSHEGEYYR